MVIQRECGRYTGHFEYGEGAEVLDFAHGCGAGWKAVGIRIIYQQLNGEALCAWCSEETNDGLLLWTENHQGRFVDVYKEIQVCSWYR